MMQRKAFHNIFFPEDRCEVMMTDEKDEVATCDNLIAGT